MSLSLVQLPSLDLIRGFVAVGRRMSITMAAEDLCVTQSAISRQIRALDDKLGLKLLLRGFRSITFTAEGERLFRSADGVIQQMQDVLGEIRAAGPLRPVTISASIGIAGLWFLPRLSGFQKLHPGVDVRVSANNKIAELRNDGVDLAIRYATSSSVPDGAIRLFGEYVAPVAHPSLSVKSLRAAQTLSKVSLLEFDDPRYPWLQWRDWLGAMGWSDVKPQGVLRFNQYDQVIQAALSAQGIALGRLELIEPLVAEGRLVVLAPAKHRSEVAHAHWLIQADERPRDEVRRLASWIVSEAREGRTPELSGGQSAVR